MHRAGRVRGGLPKCLPQLEGQLGGRGHVAAVFGDRLEERLVVNLLVGVALLEQGRLLAGQGDDGRGAQPGILQAGGQVGRAHALRHAHAWPMRSAGIAIGHIGGGFFRVRHDPAHAQGFHLHQGLVQDGIHIEDVRDPVALEGFGDEPGSGNGRGRGHYGLVTGLG